MLDQIPPFAEFCSWFPSLKRHDLQTPADLRQHLKSPACTSGSGAAARFCLAVYSAGRGSFRLEDVTSWDANHRAAFERWARNPFFY